MPSPTKLKSKLAKISAEDIRISRKYHSVTTLGPGNRIGIWLQGCTKGCLGCISKDTWDSESGECVSIRDLVEWCRFAGSKGIDGITISGGEPFEQTEALESLLKELHVWTDLLDSQVDYLCYSGKSFSELQQYPEILCLLDTIIPEPFMVELPGRPLRGSENQPIITLTELGAKRFKDLADGSYQMYKKSIQFVIDDDGSVNFIGIPDRGDMHKLVELCNYQGVFLKNVSWE